MEKTKSSASNWRIICKTTFAGTMCIGLILALAATLSQSLEARPHRKKAMTTTAIVAGYGEKNFVEKYHLSIVLPMPESVFVALFKKLHLPYEICGERGTDNEMPVARHESSVDLSKAQRCYEIDGDRDPVRHVGEGYRAFTDAHHRVFYIENVFAYTGP